MPSTLPAHGPGRKIEEAAAPPLGRAGGPPVWQMCLNRRTTTSLLQRKLRLSVCVVSAESRHIWVDLTAGLAAAE